MTFQARSMAALLGGATFAALGALGASAETVKLTLLGVGDVYNYEEEDGRGGFARLNAVAKAERAANPNTLYLFDGDMLSPSLLSGFDNFGTFFLPGSQHTFTYQSLGLNSVGGTTIGEWLGQMVDGDPTWDDVGP